MFVIGTNKLATSYIVENIEKVWIMKKQVAHFYLIKCRKFWIGNSFIIMKKEVTHLLSYYLILKTLDHEKTSNHS